MTEEVLRIGDLKVFDQPTLLKCFGLGTCVGLFITDRIRGITGGAHIFLPEHNLSNTFGEASTASECVKLLLQKMFEKGASPDYLRAKIVGGANPLMLFHSIGNRNTESVIAELIRHKVYIAAMDVGGKMSRTVKFISLTEQMTVRQLESNCIKVF